MPALHKLFLATALTALTAPAWAALTYTASGNYNVGSGATGITPTHCNMSNDATSTSQDVLKFDGDTGGNIGIHAYSCLDAGVTDFGSRASGDGTFHAWSEASVIGTLNTAENDTFSFFINPGEVGAFGSASFAAGEFQKAKLTIKLVIDNVVYLDEVWKAEVGTAGNLTGSNYLSSGISSVNSNSTSGSGYFSHNVQGGWFSFSLGSAGVHSIEYVMTSEASGNLLSTSACTAVLQDNGPNGDVAAAVAAAPQPFASYCGAGARTGDPFNDPIARPLPPTDLPEPMTAGLALTALLAAAGARRRRH